MSTVHETLKVNDELSVEVDVIYENGEKYVQENTIWTNVDGKKPSFYVSTPYFDSIECKVEIPTDPEEWCRGPKLTKAVELYKMEYINALSYQINQEYYFNFLYNCEDEVRIINLWNLWYDVDVEKLVSTWKHRYATFKLKWYSDNYIYHSDKVLDNGCFVANDEDTLFPFELRIKGERTFIHFDVFLFLLHLKFPQYKSDIMCFLKYQPVCTKTSDKLFIYNLKQTNKDLLKQLNEANHKLSIMNELEIKLKAHEETLSKQSSEIEELRKQVQDKENALVNANKEIDALNGTIDLKEKRIEKLSRIEDENEAIFHELSLIKESLENEKLKTSQWKSNYIQLKEIIDEHAQKTFKDLGDN